MDRKSKKSHKSETRKLEKKQGEQLEASAEKVQDQAEVKKVRDRQRGGTREGEEQIQGHLQSASESLGRAFEEDTKKAQEIGQETQKAADADRQERDSHYQEGRALGAAADKVKHGETEKELGKVRDANAVDAVFFNEQRKKREEIVANGRRIEKELKAQMDKLSDSQLQKAQQSAGDSGGGKKIKEEWTHPETGEKYIHKEKEDGTKHLYYGPPDTKDAKRHGHAVFDGQGRVKYNRNPVEDS